MTLSVCIDVNDKKEAVNDSMLAAADTGRAQFVGITIDTFAIRSADSTSVST